MKSKCCKAGTHVGYYNDNPAESNAVVIAMMGTFCDKCGNQCEYTDEKGNEYTTSGKLKPKEKPLIVYITFDPLLERPLCVHDKPQMECSVCGKRKYHQRLTYQLEEHRFMVKTGNKLKKIK